MARLFEYFGGTAREQNTQSPRQKYTTAEVRCARKQGEGKGKGQAPSRLTGSATNDDAEARFTASAQIR
jgi:hypothetical protein